MSRVDYSVVSAFHRLKADELMPIVSYIKAERQAFLETMAYIGDEVELRRLQGKAQFAETLLKLVDDSPVLMAKLKPAPR